MKDYHDLCLKFDVLFFACVNETLIKESINPFDIDPANYLSTTGYNQYVMLRFADVNLKLIRDIQKYEFIKSMERGGISIFYKEYA